MNPSGPVGNDAAEVVYDARGEINGVRVNPHFQGKELEAANATFFEMLAAAVDEKSGQTNG
jgi:hypothetical protein